MPSCRIPAYTKFRPVNNDTDAPTANIPTPPTITDATKNGVDDPKNHGITGRIAPAANAVNDESATPQGLPSPSGFSPSSSRASVSSATLLSAMIRADKASASSAGKPFA